MAQDKAQRQADEFDHTLNPDNRAGENRPLPHRTIPAVHITQLQNQHSELTNDILAQIPVLRSGERLQQGAVYLDLNQLQEGPFKATGGMEAREEHCYVAKNEVDFELWNLLTGDDGSNQLGRFADERESA